ncbi:hypothetical protein CN285_08125 [Bacillus cereus]|nr:hypothetical protein CN285_08125 [Bacillus cereus]PGM63785.1 hypothetical protein CN947_08710 [Bacillus cereus]
MLNKGACLFFGIDMYNNTKKNYEKIYRCDLVFFLYLSNFSL